MFHVNPLPAEDSHEISKVLFSLKNNEKYLRMSSAAVVIGALRIKSKGAAPITEQCDSIKKWFVPFYLKI